MIFYKLLNLDTPGPWLMHLLGVVKIGRNQICSSHIISYPKRTREGIPSLMLWKLHKLDIWAVLWKCTRLKNATLKSAGAKDSVYIYQEIPALKPMGYQPVSCKLWSKQSSIINKHFSVTIYISRFLSWFYLALFWNNFGALFFALVLIVLTPLNFIFWLWSYVLCSCQLFWHTN
jgi:hypothetical protein